MLRDKIIDLLNSILEAQPRVMEELISHKIEVDISKLEDVDVVVGYKESSPGVYTLGLLGILNGLTMNNRVAAVYNDRGKLLRFEPYTQPKRREVS